METFQLYSLSDQQHTVRIVRLLNSAEKTHPSLLKAALLHDIGKTRLKLSVLDRIVGFVGSVLSKRMVQRLGQESPPPYGLRKGFILRAQHPAWGADMVAPLGTDTLTLNLIRRHQDKEVDSGNPEEDNLLRLLQWADDKC